MQPRALDAAQSAERIFVLLFFSVPSSSRIFCSGHIKDKLNKIKHASFGTLAPAGMQV